jgi:hypothetical protein
MSILQEGGVVRATKAQVIEQIEALNASKENFEGWRPARGSSVQERDPARVEVYHSSFVKQPQQDER